MIGDGACANCGGRVDVVFLPSRPRRRLGGPGIEMIKLGFMQRGG